MKYRCQLISIIFFVASFMPTFRCEGGPPLAGPDAPVTLQNQRETKQTNSELPPTDRSVSYNDFTDFNVSTPEKATYSFVKLFNGILPATPATDLQKICISSTMPSYNKDCLHMLESRLNYLKSIARNLKGAMFRYQPSIKLSMQPMQLKASWQEKLSFFDNSTKMNEKNMIITLSKSDDDWKIIKIE